MSKTRLDDRFFESTRGQIVLSLRRSAKTVNELAEETDLTDNAVRAHLVALERDGLISQGGTVKGFRKPHFVYVLTNDARHLFPKAYDALLSRLLSVLKRRPSPKSQVVDALREVGHDIARENRAAENSESDRLQETVEVLAGLGGAARVVYDADQVRIESDSCPFADVVSQHPEVCKMSETLVADLVGRKVIESCDRTDLPKCRFQIEPAGRHS
jgi:predicted ArsR family transcriptional regulator